MTAPMLTRSLFVPCYDEPDDSLELWANRFGDLSVTARHPAIEADGVTRVEVEIVVAPAYELHMLALLLRRLPGTVRRWVRDRKAVRS